MANTWHHFVFSAFFLQFVNKPFGGFLRWKGNKLFRNEGVVNFRLKTACQLEDNNSQRYQKQNGITFKRCKLFQSFAILERLLSAVAKNVHETTFTFSLSKKSFFSSTFPFFFFTPPTSVVVSYQTYTCLLFQSRYKFDFHLDKAFFSSAFFWTIHWLMKICFSGNQESCDENVYKQSIKLLLQGQGGRGWF